MRGKPAERLKSGTVQSVAEVLREHVVLELEGIDRMYLNVYVPVLQAVEGVLKFIRIHRGHPVASTAMVEPITRRFVEAIERYVSDHNIPMITFAKGQRKDDIANQRRAAFIQDEGVVFVGKAQEKCTVYRTEKRRNPRTRKTYAWIVKSTALVNHYYFYCLDRDFGPFFLKFCSYFPYNAKLCLNGHEYVKRQLELRQIEYQALDDGVLCCADAKRLQALCNGLSGEKIQWGHLRPARSIRFVIERTVDSARNKPGRNTVWRSGGVYCLPSQGGVRGEGSVVHADLLAIAESDRSQRHVHGILDGRIGGRETLRTCQLAAEIEPCRRC
jgi:hypothetical protein